MAKKFRWYLRKTPQVAILLSFALPFSLWGIFFPHPSTGMYPPFSRQFKRQLSTSSLKLLHCGAPSVFANSSSWFVHVSLRLIRPGPWISAFATHGSLPLSSRGFQAVVVPEPHERVSAESRVPEVPEVPYLRISDCRSPRKPVGGRPSRWKGPACVHNRQYGRCNFLCAQTRGFPQRKLRKDLAAIALNTFLEAGDGGGRDPKFNDLQTGDVVLRL